MLFPWGFLTPLSRVLCGECGEIQNIKGTQMHVYIKTHICTFTLTDREMCLHIFLHKLWKSKNQNEAQGVGLLMNISTAC